MRWRSEIACEACEPGFYAVDELCVPCPPGTFEKGGCEPCPAGVFYSAAFATTACELCQDNYYAPAPASTVCVPVPQCETSFHFFNRSSTECVPCTAECPLFTFMASPCGPAADTLCLPCSQGPHLLRPCDATHDAIVADAPCPAGSVFSFDLSTCIPCSPGTFFASSACESCPPGAYANESGSTACEDCPPYTVATPDAVDCIDACPSGSFLALESQCAWCPPGSAGERCLLCAADTYAPLGGMAACLPCPPGLHSPVGASVCESPTCPI
jgi:hypothetical protein